MIPSEFQNRFRLRWRFDYTDKPSKIGMWDCSGDTPEEQAWYQSKTNLSYAVIEGKDRVSGRTLRLYEVLGQDFCCFEWCAVSSLPGQTRAGIGQTLNSINVGLKIVSRNKNIFVYIDGSIKVEDRLDQITDNLFHFGR